MIGHRAKNDDQLLDKALENWSFLAIEPTPYLVWQTFAPDAQYPWTAYQKMLLIADRPIQAIKDFNLPIRTAIIWDIENEIGFTRFNDYVKLAKDSSEIEMALAYCITNYWQAHQKKQTDFVTIQTECVDKHAQLSLNRPLTEHEASFLSDQYSRSSPPYKTSSAGLAEIAAAQAANLAKLNKMDDADRMINLMFHALEESSDFSFYLSGAGRLADYAIAKLRQQNRLEAK